MAKLFASWVPGYSTVAQDMGNPPLNWNGRNYTDVNGYRDGSGVHFFLQGNRANWFHVPLPTPVIVEDQRASLARVMILYGFPQGASLQSVHVWDGPNRIMKLDGLNTTGNHFGGLDADNTFDVNYDGVQWGIGISMQVSTIVDASIYFATAGGDFYHNI